MILVFYLCRIILTHINTKIQTATTKHGHALTGPTTAAGAIGGNDIIQNYLMIPCKCRTDIDDFIQNNDSFNFYSNLSDSKYHIIIGHTGTNVMDLHLLYFKNRKKNL